MSKIRPNEPMARVTPTTGAGRAASTTPTQPATTNRVAADQFAQSAVPTDKLTGGKAITVRPLPSLPLEAAPSGPIALSSPEAQAAIAKTRSHLASQLSKSASGSDFAPRAVERDSLGMLHVRMDRVVDGVPVFGEQIIGHLDANGELASVTGDLRPIPPELAGDAVEIGADAALETVLADFGMDTDVPPTAQKVYVTDPSGEYRLAYHVLAQNLGAAGEPRREHYFVDARTGEIFEQFNTIHGVIPPGMRGIAGEHVEINRTATPNAPIKDLQTVTSTIDVPEDATVDQLTVNLDLDHTWRGDLRVTVTSPSGKEVVLHNRTGGSQDNLDGSFDLTKEFAGELTRGTWTISVTDSARRDEGMLNSWNLEIAGTSVGSEPAPEPEPEPTTGNDNTLYSGTVEVGGTDLEDGRQKLLDQTRGQGIETRDANNQSRPTNSTEFVDNDGAWNQEGDSARQVSATDAQYAAQMTYDFYKTVFGRDSIDGQGEKLVNNVHINRNYVNAFWDGTQMSYGDGDGRNASHLTTLDIGGHEITHGLTERTAGLIYRGESGALNEAFSDIMSAGVEWFAMQKNPSIEADPFLIGEQAWTPGTEGDALRYMTDPTKDGSSRDHYSKRYTGSSDNGGVHWNSGIANNAFALLAAGGTNRTSGQGVTEPIGMESALKIYGRALINYMTPTTTFAQAREATIQAATDLFGADSAEVAQVKASWSAVGVG